MRKSIIATYIVAMLLIVLGSSYFLMDKTADLYFSYQERHLINQAKVIVDVLNKTEPADLEEIVRDYDEKLGLRTTIIDTDAINKVLVDTQADETLMENHQYRSEVREALEGRIGVSHRISNTTKTDYFYVAIPNAQIHGLNCVYRIASPVSTLDGLKQQVLFFHLGTLAIVLLIGTALLRRWTRTITDPLNDLTVSVQDMSHDQFRAKLPHYHDEKIELLASSFNHMVDQQNKSLQSLQQKNMELEAVFNSVDSGLACLDENKKIVTHNNLFLELLHIEPQVLSDMYSYEIMRKPELTALVKRASADHEYQTQEIPFVFDGQTFIYRVTTAPIQAKDQALQSGILVVIEDMTMIKSTDAIRKEFVANVSHELKTPLTTIRGFIETLQSDTLENPIITRKFLNIINDEADRLSRMIEQLLYLSKLDNNVLPITEKSAVHVGELMEKIQRNFAQSLAEKNLTLVIETSPEVIYYGNQDYLMQIISNLIDNAIKYSTEGTISLLFEEDEGTLHFRVQDEGIGMSAVDQKRIFERFYRAEKSRAQKKGGTGLGLAIVKHLVEILGGSIKVESTLDKGTVFLVKLPNTK